ncbi:hypothetical protein MRBLMA1_001240 [Sphingobium sp. LMA1-1-1.1]|uniref:hypothetical protein n=1 Tax=Sphingobium sp. LMA1-1-1.1 TaxID=3135238 RepID=UPI00341FABF6
MDEKKGMSFEPRSGDTHVIGEDGEAVNVDAQARAAALADLADTLKGEDGAPVTPPEGDLTDPPAPIAPEPTASGRKTK